MKSDFALRIESLLARNGGLESPNSEVFFLLQKKTSEFKTLQSLDSQLLAKSLISCLAIVGARPEKNIYVDAEKTFDLKHQT
jgi:hypothetical protein